MGHVPATDRGHPLAIDVHAHIATPGILHGVERGAWHGVALERRPDGKLESVTSSSRQPLPWADFREGLEGRLARMDGWGVDVQVLSLTPTLWRYEVPAMELRAAAREVNDDLISIGEGHADRFRVFAHVPLVDPPAAAAELERAMAASRLVVGAAVGTHVNGRDWDDPDLEPFLAAAEATGAVLFVHPAGVRFNAILPKYHLRNLIGNPAETTVAVAALIFGGVLDRHPELRFVFAHGGGYAIMAAGRFEHGQRVRPEAQQPQLPARRYLERLFFDSLTHDEKALRHLVDIVGPDHLVLGSDDPADMGRPDPARWVWECRSLDEDERRAVLGGTAVELFGSSIGADLPARPVAGVAQMR